MGTRHGAFQARTAPADQPSTALEVLDAAIKEFDESGYTQASISQIADRAGVSKSLVTYYFPTKSSLASTIVSLAFPNGVFMGVDRQVSDPLEAIVQATEHVTTCVAHYQLARVAIKLYSRREVRRGGAPARHTGWLARVADYLEEAKREGSIPLQTDVTSQARLLVAGVVGLIDLATTSGNYLSVVEESIALTRDRLLVMQARDVRPATN